MPSLEHPSIRVLALDLPFGSPEAMTWIDAEAASPRRVIERPNTTVRGYASISRDRSAGAMERKCKDLRRMRLASWKNSQPPNATPTGQSTKVSTLLDIGTTPVL